MRGRAPDLLFGERPIYLALALVICASCGSSDNKPLDTPLLSFDQDITSTITRLRLRHGQTIQLPVTVKNTGKRTLLTSGMFPVTVSYSWLTDGIPHNENSARTPLPAALPPGGQVPVTMKVVAPPAGRTSLLVVTLVQEGVAWFADRGTAGLRIPVELTPEVTTGADAAALRSDERLSAFAQKITTPVKALSLKPGQAISIPVTIYNPGPDSWSSYGLAPVTFSYRWYVGSEDRVLVTTRTLLPQPLLADKSVSLNAAITAPSAAGHYTLRLSMVQEGVQWFLQAGGKATDIPAEVR